MNSEITNNSGGLFPEKYAEYFSTLNPLAVRIFEDIRKVESKCDNFSELSYDGKCSVIDKDLCTDKRDLWCGGELPHTASLLMSVYPNKKQEENGTEVLDIAFNACSESQMSGCNLQKLVNNISFPVPKHHRASLLRKGKAPAPTAPIKSFLPNPEVIPEADKNVTCKQKLSATRGVQQDYTAPKKSGISTKLFSSTKEIMDDEEDLLPNQKQNSDLIAELQAKLKRNKTDVKSPTGECGSKVAKPKAPPPPPPTQKESSSKETCKRDKYSNSNKAAVDDDDFIVDVSSPCRIATPKTGLDFLDNW